MLGPDDIGAIQHLAIHLGLAEPARRSLLIPDPHRSAALAIKDRPDDQLLSDVTSLSAELDAHGRQIWLAEWLEAAAQIAHPRREATRLKAWARRARGLDAAAHRLVWRPPEPEARPQRPYPLLFDPYTDRRLFAGRDDEIGDLRQAIDARPIVCLFAVSGAGKSSFLRAGLIPALRSEAVPEALVADPTHPDIASELLRQLVDPAPAHADPAEFVAALEAVHRLAGRPPVLLVDQLEAVLEPDRGRAARARLGPLLSASMRGGPFGEGPLCRWVLTYRREYHGDISHWLGDVLREARAAGEEDVGPYDLRAPERRIDRSLSLFGTARPGDAADPLAVARRAFREAIAKPLARPDMPWSMAPEHVDRLAEAFARASVAQPERSQMPALQVVLSRLMSHARDGVLLVSDDALADLGRALEAHVRRRLEALLPAGRRAVKRARAWVLAALHRMTDPDGTRAVHRPAGEILGLLKNACAGAEDVDVAARRLLADLRGAGARLIVEVQSPEQDLRLTLSHDRLAMVIARMVRDRPRGSTPTSSSWPTSCTGGQRCIRRAIRRRWRPRTPVTGSSPGTPRCGRPPTRTPGGSTGPAR